jgi:hypothetical protein
VPALSFEEAFKSLGTSPYTCSACENTVPSYYQSTSICEIQVSSSFPRHRLSQ